MSAVDDVPSVLVACVLVRFIRDFEVAAACFSASAFGNSLTSAYSVRNL